MDKTDKMITYTQMLNKIKNKADEATFSKGYKYYTDGRVVKILKIGNVVKASVMGTKYYSVTIVENKNDIKWRCICPVGGLCKHIVAVVISLTNNHTVNHIDIEKIKEYLLSKSQHELAELILKHGISHTPFIESLAIDANLYNESIDIPFFKKQIDSFLDKACDTEYADVYEYVEELEEFSNQIKSLTKKFPKEVADILFYFIKQCVDTFENSGIDDSDGDFGGFIISLGELFSEAIRISNSLVPPKEFVDVYSKAADYGLEDCFNPILIALPEENLKDVKIYAEENFNKVKAKKNSWESISERYLLAAILALLGKKKEYTELCKGDKDLIEEMKYFEKQRHVK